MRLLAAAAWMVDSASSKPIPPSFLPAKKQGLGAEGLVYTLNLITALVILLMLSRVFLSMVLIAP